MDVLSAPKTCQRNSPSGVLRLMPKDLSQVSLPDWTENTPVYQLQHHGFLMGGWIPTVSDVCAYGGLGWAITFMSGCIFAMDCDALL